PAGLLSLLAMRVAGWSQSPSQAFASESFGSALEHKVQSDHRLQRRLDRASRPAHRLRFGGRGHAKQWATGSRSTTTSLSREANPVRALKGVPTLRPLSRIAADMPL